MEKIPTIKYRKVIFGIIVLIIILLVFLYVHSSFTDSGRIVNSFEECVEAGYPILDSYPEQCETPDGRRFSREIGDDELSPEVVAHINSKKDLIVIREPRPFEEISSPLTFKGEARGFWYFEADFPIRIEDNNGNIIARSFATARLDPEDPNSTWMTEDFVPFEGIIEFGTSLTETGILVFEKDNPSGLPENYDELRIPVKFAVPEISDVRMRTINLYYYDPSRDQDETGNIICSENGLVAVKREIPVSLTPVQDTISLLLQGEISTEESARGVTTEFPLEGFKLEGVATRDEVLILGFSDPYNATSGGSCRAGIIWLQIRETAMQFDGINEVTFQPEYLFQP